VGWGKKAVKGSVEEKGAIRGVLLKPRRPQRSVIERREGLSEREKKKYIARKGVVGRND